MMEFICEQCGQVREYEGVGTPVVCRICIAKRHEIRAKRSKSSKAEQLERKRARTPQSNSRSARRRDEAQTS